MGQSPYSSWVSILCIGSMETLMPLAGWLWKWDLLKVSYIHFGESSQVSIAAMKRNSQQLCTSCNNADRLAATWSQTMSGLMQTNTMANRCSRMNHLPPHHTTYHTSCSDYWDSFPRLIKWNTLPSPFLPISSPYFFQAHYWIPNLSKIGLSVAQLGSFQVLTSQPKNFSTMFYSWWS